MTKTKGTGTIETTLHALAAMHGHTPRYVDGRWTYADRGSDAQQTALFDPAQPGTDTDPALF